MKRFRQVRSLAPLAASLVLAAGAAAQGVGALDGIWLGTLHAGEASLRVQLHLDQGGTKCAFDSVDQTTFGIPCGNVVLKGEDVSFNVPAV